MEIYQNSILKLVIRQGADLDRKSIILDSGELGYTTDTKRVYIGDGFLSGGNIVGNLFRGYAPTITNVSLWPSAKGDSAFSTDTNKLYVIKEGNGSQVSDWLLVGGVYTVGNPQIAISDDNKISLMPLSANFISSDALSSPLTITSGRISLSPLPANYISTDALTNRLKLTSGRLDISPISSNYIDVDALSSPISLRNGKISLSPLSANHISPNAVEGPITITNGKISLSSSIPFQTVSTNTITIGSGLNVIVNGVNSTNVPFNPLSASTLITSNHIYAIYNGLSSGGMIASNGMLGVDTISAGFYRFVFNSNLPTINYIPHTQILGLDALGFQPRVVSTTLSSCEVMVINNTGTTTNANITLHITY